MTPQKTKGKRNGMALSRAIEDAAAMDDLHEVEAMSDAELDRFIAESGGDPRAIRAAGEALVSEVLARKARLSWHTTFEEKLEQIRAEATAKVSGRARLPRAEILSRIAQARKDPRFQGAVATLFQKKSEESSTDDELSLLLVQIELLAKLEEP